jgi:hypothetical protein
MAGLRMDRCDHLAESGSPDLVVKLGDGHVLLLCRDCSACIEAAILRDVMRRGVADYLRQRHAPGQGRGG